MQEKLLRSHDRCQKAPSGSRFFCALLVGLTASHLGLADEYHYRDVPIGERAAGLGGAFTAVSDDPSGIYYNPAGLAYSMENYFSLSANVYSTSSQTYENVIPGQSYQYTSSNLIPSFFGMTQSFGKWKVGLAVLVPNADLYDQNDTLTNVNSQDGKPGEFRRRYFRQDTTYLFGPALAREILPSLTLGVSVLAFTRTDKVIDLQMILYNPIGTTGKYYLQEFHRNLNAFGLIPKIGLQWMPHPKVGIGLTFHRPWNLTTSGRRSFLGNTDATPNGSFINDYNLSTSDRAFAAIPEVSTLRLGVAYFPSKTLLFSADAELNGPVTAEFYTPYGIPTTWNFSLGSEVFLLESLALRAGFYTNNSRTHTITSGRNRPPHVDLLGGALGISLNRPGSSVTLGVNYEGGTGLGQALGDTEQTQTLKMQTLAISFMGSYQL